MDVTKKKILIVSNQNNIIKLLGYVLGGDYDLEIRRNGMEALFWLEEGNDPNLIISGLKMPYFDGSSLIKSLKTSGLYREIPIIVISGASNLEERINAIPFKIEKVFEKPFNPTVLKQSVAALIN